MAARAAAGMMTQQHWAVMATRLQRLLLRATMAVLDCAESEQQQAVVVALVLLVQMGREPSRAMAAREQLHQFLALP
jgi:hypothetical protein